MERTEALDVISRSDPKDWTQEMRGVAARADDLRPGLRSDVENALLKAWDRLEGFKEAYWRDDPSGTKPFPKYEFSDARTAVAAFQDCQRQAKTRDLDMEMDR